ncbi:hypothetical protein BU26DRAFT_161952 [Trematosphaeria pertusa]|uniref:Uncharacterized protein n=1 Tax=Trematosphaeria pertusa TaxID=390896 RepID=A0A6A6HUT1_9PLEO|nr:uncharacterized protein BU26DRAFT_161952 [Trematosphaeria pertusa]KAF2241934.1 hypothetical protein BU26DRAFT_161952 [Trematosphaeria pertusa]
MLPTEHATLLLSAYSSRISSCVGCLFHALCAAEWDEHADTRRVSHRRLLRFSSASASHALTMRRSCYRLSYLSSLFCPSTAGARGHPNTRLIRKCSQRAVRSQRYPSPPLCLLKYLSEHLLCAFCFWS